MSRTSHQLNPKMNTEAQIEEIKLRVQNARAAAFAASHSDYPSDRESAMAELTAALDAAIAATITAADACSNI